MFYFHLSSYSNFGIIFVYDDFYFGDAAKCKNSKDNEFKRNKIVTLTYSIKEWDDNDYLLVKFPDHRYDIFLCTFNGNLQQFVEIII